MELILKEQQAAIQRNHVYNTDCIQVLKRLPAQSVDLVIARPITA